MRIRLAGAVLGVLLSFNAIARDAKVLQQTDKFSGITTYFTPKEEVKLEGGSFLSGRYVFFSLKGFSGRPQDYTLQVDAQLSSWVFLHGGAEAADLKIDGQIVPVLGTGSADARIVESGNIVDESAQYRIPPDILQRIAAAQVVEFRLYGDQGAITGTLTPIILADMRQFAAIVPAKLGTGGAPQGSSPSHLTLGVSFVDYLQGGALVAIVNLGSPAAAAGVQVGDVITDFDGKPIRTKADLIAAVLAHTAGQVASISVLRASQRLDLHASM